VDLVDPLSAGKSLQVDVETVYTHLLKPYPSEITQQEKQLIRYHGNNYLYSPYTVAVQNTKVLLASSTVESYTKLKPTSHSDTTITCGPYENVQPFTENELLIHTENNAPFLTVAKLVRLVEVSHWGNIAVEESIELRHTGATLKGSFSRYEYQREQNGISSIKSFKTMLPAAATDVYYRDEIGNISTSHLRVLDDSVELDLRPRFPLFGGWKTHYLVGYNIPSYEYLFNSGNDYVLKLRYIDHIYDDMVADEATLKVILPEGAKNIKLKAPYEIVRDDDQLHYTYLDTVGRPVVIAHKNNLVENHIQDVELHYTFDRYLMLQEPLLAVITLYLLFLLVIVYVRLDFSISKDEASESRLRASGFVEKVQKHHERRCAIYSQLEGIVSAFKSQRDNTAFQNSLKRFNMELKCETQEISDLQGKLRPESPDVAEKVGEIQKLDRQAKEQQQTWVTMVEKVVSGKLGKQQYADAEGNLRKKLDELVDKMEQIINTL
jgi:oligosaccharyltransferase complex subunit alpha (ribophorin I)